MAALTAGDRVSLVLLGVEKFGTVINISKSRGALIQVDDEDKERVDLDAVEWSKIDAQGEKIDAQGGPPRKRARHVVAASAAGGSAPAPAAEDSPSPSKIEIDLISDDDDKDAGGAGVPPPPAEDDSDVEIVEPAAAAGPSSSAPPVPLGADRASRSKQSSKQSSTASGKAKAPPPRAPPAAPDDDDDDDAVEAGAPPPPAPKPAPKPSAGKGKRKARAEYAAEEEEEPELEITGHRGELALVDYPHCRENCATHAFVKGKYKDTCENCYCFVCDTPTSECTEWAEHSQATHTSQKWVALRDAKKAAKAGGGGAAGGGAASSAAASRPLPAASSKPAFGFGFGGGYVPSFTGERWSCDEILARVQQVYPIEEAVPAGLTPGTVLRPYQKQSVAFMKHVEHDAGLERNGFPGSPGVRGGWLADEVGMGKTLVVTSLILASKAKGLKPVTDAAFKNLDVAGAKPMDFGLTLVVVNNTLVQQWADELKKFAPGLECHMFYASKENKKRAMARLRSTDVLLTTPHMLGCAQGISLNMLANMRIHRLVIDEAHLISEGSMAQKLSSLQAVQAKAVWLVSGTPISTSVSKLKAQCQLLHLWTDFGTKLRTADNEQLVEWLRLRMIRHTKSMRIGGEVALALPKADCETVWLTMSDDERLLYGIHECGDGHGLQLEDRSRFRAASHLYDEEVVTGARLARTDFEDDGHGGRVPVPISLDRPAKSGKFAEATAAYKRAHESVQITVKPTARQLEADPTAQPHTRTERRPVKSLTKYAKLLSDLKELREQEPSFHAVVFTRFDEVQARLVQLVQHESRHASGELYDAKAPPLKIFEFNQHTAPTSRHKRIQEFQQGMGASGGPAKVFIVTYQTAAVGITLTAATRIFLMEPMLDPAAEVQAAGRIHRLGQTHDVFIKRYAFRDSIEEATDKLHESIRSGDIKVRDGKFPPEAHALFRKHGPSQGLFKQRGEVHGKLLRGEGILDWQGHLKRPMPKKGEAPILLKPSSWTRHCTEEECRLCGVRRISRSSSKWEGTGIYAFLHGGAFDGVDPPPPGQGVGHFYAVPTPPPNWQPERFGKAPLALLNMREVRDAKQVELERNERNANTPGSNGGAGGGGSSGGGGTSADDALDVTADDDEEEGEGEGEEEDDEYEYASELDCSAGDTDDLSDETDDETMEAFGFGAEANSMSSLPIHVRRPWLQQTGYMFAWMYHASKDAYDLTNGDRYDVIELFEQDYPEAFGADDEHEPEPDNLKQETIASAKAAVAEIAQERLEVVEYEDDEMEAAAQLYADFVADFEGAEPEPMAGASSEFYEGDDEEADDDEEDD